MNLDDLINRNPNPEPWSEGDNIPWSDPDFSVRMLKEHLSQEHDAASRRFENIDKHVQWIHQSLLSGKPSRILDLCCGPGLYANRLAKLGHECVGIDYSPASIAYAKTQATEAKASCQYHHSDVRQASFGSSFDFATLIFGELNVFKREDAKSILNKAHAALNGSGTLLLEPHDLEAVKEIGSEKRSWYSADKGLFSDKPHICMKENFWDETLKTSTTRYHIIDASTKSVSQYSSSMQAYTKDEYLALLTQCGFSGITFQSAMSANPEDAQPGLFVILAHKEEKA